MLSLFPASASLRYCCSAAAAYRAFRHARRAELGFRVCGIKLSGLLVCGERFLRLAVFSDLGQREPCRGESLLATDGRLESDGDF